MGWYASWHEGYAPLAEVSWNKYTHMAFASVTTNSNSSIALEETNTTLLQEFVSTAHNNSVKALVSVGGWDGSRFFSSSVGDATNRTAFVKALTNMVSNYSLDGIDFDWEYPNGAGLSCNTISPNDTSNFLSLLQELRDDPIGGSLVLSAAASIRPWNDATGQPSANLSDFALVLDHIAIMDYDLFGSWSDTAGPNSALNDTCAPTTAQTGSAVSAVNAWSTAGIPKDKIVLGVPSYGRSFNVSNENAFPNGTSTLALFPAFDKNNQPLGDSWDSPGVTTDACGNESGPSGVFEFRGLIEEGYLTENGTVVDGVDYVFDDCSQTPRIYNSTSQVYIAYDNAQSMAAKGSFIASQGLRGFAIWETGGDRSDILLDSIRSSIGFS
ncbi:glycoside hydrolase family 18 protein [Stereum hirsutum FP-91666 SS1]|uniref:glycoside hydrolase family 18 protein n=1 Tax=Stereum hirsutum (strain FP-91666) TaxID=721885 RepID=UPI000444925F|nr:glycoside hydrolase family 18 protein [Stereum hirsutum FP-91666 SS1]EIM82845.1 glycoside hydrolase family 18 protein [Stereum hirsutum FP-91666 SS1]